jgi:regulator of sirC expression with transglutaminase-like and TPR domain
LLVGISFILLTAFVSSARADPTSLIDEIERLEHEAEPLCPSLLNREPLGKAVDGLVSELRAATHASTGGDDPVRTFSDFVFKTLAIRPSHDLHDPCNLLPSAVLVRKEGYCVGIVALYLALAERLDLPIYAVNTPSHVFLRYDEGHSRTNIETFELGASVPDERYIADEKIAPRLVRRGIFLRELTTDEFLAEMRNNLGVVYSERKDHVAAEREYQAALDLDRYLPAAWYNWGNDLLGSGDYTRAAKVFTQSLRLYPTDVWALNNRGVAYKKLGKVEKARRDFEEALKIDPGFEQARKNLEGLAAPP